MKHKKEHDYNKDPQVQELINHIDGYKCIIAGGYPLSKVQRLYGNLASRYNDIDIFCSDQKEYDKIIKEVETFATLNFDSTNAKSYRVTPKQIHPANAEFKFQVIKPNPKVKTLEELVENFDLNNSKYWLEAPWNKIYTNQDNSKLHMISPSDNIKWNYQFLGRMLKYMGTKQMKLPDDTEFCKNLGVLFMNQTKEVYTFKSYNGTKNPDSSALDTQVFDMLDVLHKEAHRVAWNIQKDINQGKSSYLHLEKIFQSNNFRASNFGGSVDNFLFNYWMQKQYFDDIQKGEDLIGGIGAKLENEYFYKSNVKKVQKHFPELLL